MAAFSPAGGAGGPSGPSTDDRKFMTMMTRYIDSKAPDEYTKGRTKLYITDFMGNDIYQATKNALIAAFKTDFDTVDTWEERDLWYEILITLIRDLIDRTTRGTPGISKLYDNDGNIVQLELDDTVDKLRKRGLLTAIGQTLYAARQTREASAARAEIAAREAGAAAVVRAARAENNAAPRGLEALSERVPDNSERYLRGRQMEVTRDYKGYVNQLANVLIPFMTEEARKFVTENIVEFKNRILALVIYYRITDNPKYLDSIAIKGYGGEKVFDIKTKNVLSILLDGSQPLSIAVTESAGSRPVNYDNPHDSAYTVETKGDIINRVRPIAALIQDYIDRATGRKGGRRHRKNSRTLKKRHTKRRKTTHKRRN